MHQRRPHVGHVVDCFGAGGIATGVLELIRATQGVIEHSIISLVDDLRLLSQLPTEPPAHVLRPGPTRLLGFSSRLAWLAYRRRIDILHCNNHFAWLDSSVAARMTGCLSLQTFHGVEKPLQEMPRDIRLKCRLAAQLGHAVTAVSSASRKMVCTLGDLAEEAVTVIPNGVDLKRFTPSPPQGAARSALRAALGLAAESRLVAHVAGLRPIKDQVTLLRAWRLVRDGCVREPRARPVLLLVGEGECRAALETLAAELGIHDDVRFLGQRRDVDQLLPACDLFVLSSLSEGMSFAILEAMAAGLPVVATRVGGNGELVEEGKNGLLVPPRDPEALAAPLMRLLREPHQRRAMAAQSRRLVEQHYDQATTTQRYLALYQGLAAQRRRRPVAVAQL